MPRLFWIPVALLGLGVGVVGFVSFHQPKTTESCATCAAATVSDRELAQVTPPAKSQEKPQEPAFQTEDISCGTKPSDDDEAPDFSGPGIEMVRTRHLMKLPAREENVTREDLQARILRQMEGYFPAGHGLKEGRALAALGALPAAVDTLGQQAAWWAQFLGAWYDPETDTMLLGRDEDGRSIVENNRRGVAFALLMREHGDWLKKSPAAYRMDAWLARLTLLAGDAAFTSSLNARKTEVVLLPANTAPRDFLEDLNWGCFNAGENFVKASHHMGDFDQVNATYERPPIATAELMDPGLYFSGEQFAPDIPAWTDLKVSGQEPFWDDTLGQLATGMLLWQGLPQKEAEEASAGWQGDRWLAYDAGDNARGHMAWQTLWKDKAAADKFYAAMQRLLRTKHPESPAPAGGPGPWRWSADGRNIILAHTDGGEGVFYADAATPAFAEALWKKFVPP